MKIIRSWCKKIMGEKESFDDFSEIHAKCDDCLKKQKNETEGFPSKGLLERTIQFWQPRCHEKLTPDAAREICHNMTNLIYLLDDLDKKYRTEPAETNPAA